MSHWMKNLKIDHVYALNILHYRVLLFNVISQHTGVANGCIWGVHVFVNALSQAFINLGFKDI